LPTTGDVASKNSATAPCSCPPASATAWTSTPGNLGQLHGTPLELQTVARKFLSSETGRDQTPPRLLTGSVYRFEGGSLASFKRLLGCTTCQPEDFLDVRRLGIHVGFAILREARGQDALQVGELACRLGMGL